MKQKIKRLTSKRKYRRRERDVVNAVERSFKMDLRNEFVMVLFTTTPDSTLPIH